MSEDLSFKTLQLASRERGKLFRNARGELVRKQGTKWTPERWCVATVGELGEFANKLKKTFRGDFGVTIEEAKKGIVGHPACDDADVVKTDLAGELADAAIYLALLADSLNIDLAFAVQMKFNEKSREMPEPRIMLHGDGYFVEGDEWWEGEDGNVGKWFFAQTYWWQISAPWDGSFLMAIREGREDPVHLGAKQLRGATPHRLYDGLPKPNTSEEDA